ncbi:hypothetical protein LARI1_G005641 [Lachnellula arida]|uniref:Uncharacterized protein n=1 Tax=Lachnellula arida TaxID=1316785 RepID=A0A8T9BKH1_9HELO|nr:hypothetical protein LARI1_G005641 [Lachnellula arida]
MAPTETPKQPESSKVDNKPETAQNPSTDPSTAGHLQQTVSGSNPATEEILQGATSSSSNEEYVSNGALINHS